MKLATAPVTALVTAFLSGLLFGLGLLLAGMANPAKVLGFLDLGGAWDPSLAVVMGGGIAVGLVGFTIARRRSLTLLGAAIDWPDSRKIDQRLIGGSVLFGIGWGLAGICPGPALVLLGTGALKGLVFVGAMIAGMAVYELFERGPFIRVPRTPV